jgi:hypothetical protein
MDSLDDESLKPASGCQPGRSSKCPFFCVIRVVNEWLINLLDAIISTKNALGPKSAHSAFIPEEEKNLPCFRDQPVKLPDHIVPLDSCT